MFYVGADAVQLIDASRKKYDAGLRRASANRYRYYDPTTGRYITSDPIGLDGGLNTYGYVDANPLMYFDEEGLSKNRGGGKKNARIEKKAQRLRARVQGLRDQLRNAQKRREDRLQTGQEEADILDWINDLLDELDRLKNYIPTICIEWKCSWDKPQCYGEPTLTPVRAPSTGCQCVKEIAQTDNPFANPYYEKK